MVFTRPKRGRYADGADAGGEFGDLFLGKGGARIGAGDEDLIERDGVDLI